MPKVRAKKSEGTAPKQKSKGSKKNSGGPKRPLSAYMFFSQDWRERIKAENPDAGFGEIGKLLGAKWKEMNDEEKTPYVDQAAQDKVRAEKEKEAFADSKKSKKQESVGSGDEEEE